MRGPTRYAMRYSDTHHLKVCSAVPPYILESIAFNSAPGSAEAKAAKATLVDTSRLRGQRDVLAFTMPDPSARAGKKNRNVYDARHSQRLPGVLRLHEAGSPPPNDLEVAEAYNGAGATYDLFFDIFGRNSLDDRGLTLNSTTYYQRHYQNAFWNGQQMVYGDGDGRIFDRFTKAIDVCGHELTHGLTQYTCALNYEGQSGALNESFSDCMGSLVKQRLLKQTADKADWVIGAGLLMPGVQGTGIRNMLAPGTAYDDPKMGADPQPGSMADYVVTEEDNGGVHLNSGIPNRAFALSCVGVGGFAWEKVGRICYRAMANYVQPNDDFAAAARAMVRSAGELYGVGSNEEKAVTDAWKTVGVAF